MKPQTSNISVGVITGIILATLVTAMPAAGYTASSLLREGDALPGSQTETISSISNTAVNHAGGYAVTFNSAGTATLSHVFGNGAVIRTESTFGDYEQTSFESFFGISNSMQVGYSPTVTDTSTGTTGLDTAWLDDTPILMEEQPIASLPGMYSTFNSRVGVSAGGDPYWVGGFSDTQGGSSQNRALFYGTNATPLIKGGDAIGGVPETLGTGSSNIDFDYRFSASGGRYISPMLVDSGSTINDGVIVANGSAMVVGGSVMREASPVPAAVGGLSGENWDNFDFVGVTDTGDFFVTGDTDAASGLDEFVMLNGQIVLREGDALGVNTVSGSIEGGYLNEDGDWAAIWDVNTPGGDNVEALIFNGDLIMLEGDAVDWNGDGVIDAADNNGVLANFTGISALTVGDRYGNGLVDLYFTADIDFDGTSSTLDDLEGAFRLTIPEPSTLVLLALGLIATVRRN